MEKNTKSIIGIGLLGLAAYWAYTQFTGEEEITIGGSGSFTGLGGAGETRGETGLLDNIAGTSDSGVSYNINLPSVDTGMIESILNQPTASNGEAVITSSPTAPTKKEAVTTSKPATSSGGILDSIAGSLSQVFGTESQKTNERGDYYTTAAGGGAGAVKGLSLGEQALNLLSGKTASGKTIGDATLPTGATTATDSRYDLSGLSKSDLQKIVEADKTKKEEQAAAIAQTKIAAPKPTSTIDILSYLKSGGTLTNISTGATITGKTSSSSNVTKKAAYSTYKEGGQTKYKDASGKVHIVANKSK